MNEEPRHILWTGGFDSTYLVVDALLTGHRVEAITYRGNGAPRSWEKTQMEDEARRRITHGLTADQRRRLRATEFEDRVTFQRLRDVWEEICATQPGSWSPQWQFLLPLPKMIGRSMEAGLVADDHSMEQPAIVSLAEREGFVFPLADARKAAMLADSKDRGFAHLLALSWSCEDSGWTKANEPCGRCEPCKARIIP